jgi:hypothetical protein
MTNVYSAREIMADRALKYALHLSGPATMPLKMPSILKYRPIYLDDHPPFFAAHLGFLPLNSMRDDPPLEIQPLSKCSDRL